MRTAATDLGDDQSAKSCESRNSAAAVPLCSLIVPNGHFIERQNTTSVLQKNLTSLRRHQAAADAEISVAPPDV